MQVRIQNLLNQYYKDHYKDGREIMSESFSGYYSKVGNTVADAFVIFSCLGHALARPIRLLKNDGQGSLHKLLHSLQKKV